MKLSSKQGKNKDKSKYLTVVLSIFFLCLGTYLGWKNIPGFIKANVILLSKVEITDILSVKNDLDNIRLDVPFKSLQSIETKRQNALEKGLLISSDEDFVKAEISQNGKKNKCKIRLKGDLPDHWSNHKISLRVKMEDSNIDGLLNFALQRHGTRQDTGQWLFLKSLREEDIMTVDFDFVNLELNGKSLGVYAKEGHFSNDIFEKNKRRESVIISFDESRNWEQNENLTEEQLANKILYYSEIVVRREKSVMRSQYLSEQAVVAKNLLRNFINQDLKPEDVFDKESLGKFLALTRIWSADHALHPHNINFYLNPITCKLEPIGFDGEPGYSEHPIMCYHLNDSPFLSWVKIALKSEVISEAYSRYLKRFSSDEYYRVLKSKFSTDEQHFRNLIIRNLIFNDEDMIWSSYYTLFTSDIWRMLDKRFEKIRNEFTRNKPLEAFILKHKNGYVLKVKNCIEKPIEIIGLCLGGVNYRSISDMTGDNNDTFLKPAKYILDPQTSESSFLNFNLTSFSDDIDPQQLSLKSKFSGTESFFFSKISFENFKFNKSNIVLETKALGIDKLDFISIKGNQIFFNSGEHIIRQPIYVDEGYSVNIPKGTTLLFSEDSFFISRSSIHARGSKNEPIKFSAFDKKWPGLSVISSEGKSKFQNVIFNDLCGIGKANNPMGIISGGWNLTGGINFYKSDVNFSKCSFYNCFSEDALNIISSTFLITDCTFSYCLSDAFDGDFVEGYVSGCSFENIEGDGVDFSGSVATVKNSIFNSITDKAISVGENSQVNVISCNIDNVSFGVVSKDSSKTFVSSGTIVNNPRIAAFSAFQKKDSFGPATIKVSKSKILNCKKLFLIQEGSEGKHDGKRVKTSVFKTRELY